MLCVALLPPLKCALGASCRCRLRGALLVCFRSTLLVRAREPALRLGLCLLGFPAVACAVSPRPTIASLRNTPCTPLMLQRDEVARYQRLTETSWAERPHHPLSGSLPCPLVVCSCAATACSATRSSSGWSWPTEAPFEPCG